MPETEQSEKNRRGFFGKILSLFVYSPGPMKTLECRTCHNLYLGNVHKKMPHAVCDACLDISLGATKLIGDPELHAAMEWEFNRRKHTKS